MRQQQTPIIPVSLELLIVTKCIGSLIHPSVTTFAVPRRTGQSAVLSFPLPRIFRAVGWSGSKATTQNHLKKHTPRLRPEPEMGVPYA